MSEKAKVEQTRVYSRAVVTTICLCLTLAAIGAAAALPSAQIMPSSQEVQPGESFTVGLFLDRDNITVSTGSVEYLTFDPTVVETAVENVIAGDLWNIPTINSCEVNNTAGTIAVEITEGYILATQNASGNFTTVTFRVKESAAPGEYPINLTGMSFTEALLIIPINTYETPDDIAVTNGAFTVISPVTTGDIIVNEIMYHPNGTTQGSDAELEWIELYNNDVQRINLNGWRIDGYVLSTTVGLDPGSYAVLARNKTAFENYYESCPCSVIAAAFDLGNDADTVVLKDPLGATKDTVSYLDDWGADGNGRTLERTASSGWEESRVPDGTPCLENSVLAPYYGVQLTVDEQAKTIGQGGSARYTFTVTNTGNVRDTFTLTKSILEQGTLNKTSVEVNAGASETVTLEVSPPLTGVYNTTVTATSEGDDSKSKSITVTTTVQAVRYGVNLTVDEAEQTVVQDEPAVYHLSVENTGNREDTINLTLAGIGSLSTTSVTLDGGSRAEVQLTVTNATAGVYSTTVTATSRGDSSKSANQTVVTTVVARSYGVELTVVGDAHQTTKAGVAVTFTLTVSNTGNTADTIDLTQSGTLGTLNKTSVTLAASASEEVTLVLSLSTAGEYSTTVTATSQGDASKTASETVTTTVERTTSKRGGGGGGGGSTKDSDSDGYLDLIEQLQGTDPNDPCDPDPACVACLATTAAATPKPTATAKPTTKPSPTVTKTIWKPKATPTPAPEVPGFEAIFAIAGLAALAYLVLRRKYC